MNQQWSRGFTQEIWKSIFYTVNKTHLGLSSLFFSFADFFYIFSFIIFLIMEEIL